MKIADVTVGTEYAKVTYAQRGETQRSLLSRANRVLVVAILKGGIVRYSAWNKVTKTFQDETHTDRAANLVMPWEEAIPIRQEIRESKARSAALRADVVAREQRDLLRLGEFLDDHDAGGMPGLPYTLRGSIALARGEERTQMDAYNVPNRHEPTLPLNVTTLMALLDLARSES